MDLLEALFYHLEEEPAPRSPEFQEILSVEANLMGKVKDVMGEEMMEKVSDIFCEREEIECYRYFLWGLRLGLELLRL